MAVLNIVRVGDPRLRMPSRPVQRITPQVRRLVEDMVETMRAYEGAGLAAVQVGTLWRIIVVEVPKEEETPGSGKLYVVINPEIAKRSRRTVVGIEGCLSVPGYYGEVERAEMVVVRGKDLRGRPFRLRAEGFLARVFQHEIDHCQGVLYIDRLTAPDRIWMVREGEEEKAEMEQRDGASAQVQIIA